MSGDKVVPVTEKIGASVWAIVISVLFFISALFDVIVELPLIWQLQLC